MIPIGDGKIAASPAILILEVALVVLVCRDLIRGFLYLWRASRARLALRAAQREFPHDKVESTAVKNEEGQRYAYLTMASGRVHKYLIVPQDEIAIRQHTQ